MIEIKDFKKLKQLSRIEFLLRKQRLREYRIDNHNNVGKTLKRGLILFLLEIMFLTYGIYFNTITVYTFNILFSLLKVTAIFFILIALIQIILNFKLIFDLKKEDEKLEKEFFKFKTEVKKK